MDSASIPCAPGEFYCPATQRCSADGTTCLALSDVCGDGERQPGEACDDGNRRDGDGCNHSCTSNETCGNGFQDPNEACDDGNHTDGDGCNHSCTSDETCGNRYVDLDKGEVCDDGNNRGGDKCSDNCLSNETCGNGYKDPLEACDDGNNDNNDQCSADCKVEGQGCGNGIIEPKESCDDGDANHLNDCSNDCTLVRCGDGIVSSQASYPEQCDPGSKGETSTCNANCTAVECGDGIVNSKAGEQCDPGEPNTDTATCTRSCHISLCGDGYVNKAAGEQCEDGNSDSCGSCSSTCGFPQAPAYATGFINAAAAEDLDAGEAFTLDDGINPPTTFQFSNSNDNSGRMKKIRLQGTAAEMAQAIITAINAQGWNLNIQATLDSRPNEADRVQLKHWFQTSLGNRAITYTVKTNQFQASGMARGVAGNCPETMGCSTSQDCAPWLQCRNGICSPR